MIHIFLLLLLLFLISSPKRDMMGDFVHCALIVGILVSSKCVANFQMNRTNENIKLFGNLLTYFWFRIGYSCHLVPMIAAHQLRHKCDHNLKNLGRASNGSEWNNFSDWSAKVAWMFKRDWMEIWWTWIHLTCDVHEWGGLNAYKQTRRSHSPSMVCR